MKKINSIFQEMYVFKITDYSFGANCEIYPINMNFAEDRGFESHYELPQLVKIISERYIFYCKSTEAAGKVGDDELLLRQ